jgi:protein-S-isoprenylcysteine O-methyltransferase Ste14
MNPLYRRVIRKSLVGTVFFLAAIFIPAGTFHYWQGWMLFITFSVLSVLTTLYMALYDKELLERRLRMGRKAEKTATQKAITAVGFRLFVVSIVVMVLDHRFGWSPALPAYLSIVGDAFGVLGYLIYFLVIRENRFAAATIEVAEGQNVISTGPYALVRHPMYSGAILMLLWMPITLGSWWGLLFAPLFVATFAWRLLDEERFLLKNLPGYEEYTRKVLYRLVPLIW